MFHCDCIQEIFDLMHRNARWWMVWSWIIEQRGEATSLLTPADCCFFAMGGLVLAILGAEVLCEVFKCITIKFSGSRMHANEVWCISQVHTITCGCFIAGDFIRAFDGIFDWGTMTAKATKAGKAQENKNACSKQIFAAFRDSNKPFRDLFRT